MNWSGSLSNRGMAGYVIWRFEWRHSLAGPLFSLALAMGKSIYPVAAQERTPDPSAWRPLSSTDLSKPSPTNAIFAEIWKDWLDGNNTPSDQAQTITRQATAAPAEEVHFGIWSPEKSVVLSIFNSAAACTPLMQNADIGITIRRCPMRVVFYQGIFVRVMDAGFSCIPQFGKASSSAQQKADPATSYAAYDVAAKTIKIGLIVNHQAIEACSHNIPLYPP